MHMKLNWTKLSGRYPLASIQANQIINKYREASEKASKNEDIEKEFKRIQ